METDPFPAMSDIEYSVIMSDAIKSFDCKNIVVGYGLTHIRQASFL